MPWRRYCTFKSLGYSCSGSKHVKPEPKKKARRAVRRDLRPIAGLLDDVRAPQFCISVNLDTHYCDFQVAAIILHRGDSINSGHYVCIWKIGPTLLLLEDACTARACTPSDLLALDIDAHLIWYIRRQADEAADVPRSGVD